MNIACILARISSILNSPALAVAEAAGPAAASPGSSAALMEQANATAGRSPVQARQLRRSALAMLRVVR